jgi:hypothetical protein
VWAIRCASVLGGVVLIGSAVASAIEKSLWDWLKLLIVPVVLLLGGALGGYFFTRSENRRAQRIADQGECYPERGRPERG